MIDDRKLNEIELSEYQRILQVVQDQEKEIKQLKETVKVLSNLIKEISLG